MTQQELLKKVRLHLAWIDDTITAKNSDYSDKNDAFNNFRYSEELGITSTDKAMFVRMCDKMSRIANLLNKEANVKDETIHDTLLDLAAYSILLSIYIDDGK